MVVMTMVVGGGEVAVNMACVWCGVGDGGLDDGLGEGGGFLLGLSH